MEKESETLPSCSLLIHNPTAAPDIAFKQTAPGCVSETTLMDMIHLFLK